MRSPIAKRRLAAITATVVALGATTVIAPEAHAAKRRSKCFVVKPTDNVQHKLNQRAKGAKFCFKPGVYKLSQPLKPRSRQILVGAKNRKSVLHGNGSTPAAIVPGGIMVKIKRFKIKHFANKAQKGAIDSRGGGSGWVIKKNTVSHNGGVGICVSKNAKIIGNFVHRNGQMGLCGAGKNIKVLGNQIAYNNTKSYDPMWEAGGAKFVYTNNLLVKNNYSHHNHGPGLWTDVNNINTVYRKNRVEKNTLSGIFHEVSYDAVIANNVIRGNGYRSSYWRDGAGILINSSPNVKVFKNRLNNNNHGINVTQTDRRAVPASFGPHEVSNVYVHHNVVKMRRKTYAGDNRSYTGLHQGVGDTSYYTSRNNHFEHNTYFYRAARSYWWMNDFRTKKEWKSFGLDKKGRFKQIS